MKAAATAGRNPSLSLFPIALGAFLALTLLKFGNPVILDHRIVVPATFWDVVVGAWPLAWAYPLVAALCLWGMWLRLRSPPESGRVTPGTLTRLVVSLPLAWFLWQCLSASQTVHSPLTQATLLYFAGAAIFFYLGYFALPRIPNLALMWLLTLFGLVAVIGSGFDQHFGGLEATRRFIQSQPDWQNQSPEFLKKIASNRIFATLFYPNTLAGVLLLFVPPAVATALTFPARKLLGLALACLVAFGGIACLSWSGSKAGWLIAMLLALIAWLHTSKAGKLAYLVVGLCVVAGLIGFYLKHADYFERGAKSVGARFDYWNVALKIVVKHPVLGSGPGTFSVLYRYMKPPEAEMTRLVHNDYLEQASDSGVMGCLLYSAFVLSSLILLRPTASATAGDPSQRRDAAATHSGDGRATESLHASLSVERDHEEEVSVRCPPFGVSGWTEDTLKGGHQTRQEVPERAPLPMQFAAWLGVIGWAVQSLVEFGLYVPALGWSAFLLMGWLWGTRSTPKPIDNPSLA